MNIEELKQVLDLVRDHELVELELEHGGTRLRIRKDSVHPPAQVSMALPALASAAPGAVAPASPMAVQASTVASSSVVREGDEGAAEAVELAVMTSPIVGTFYRAPAPGAPAFVEVGSIVKKGQVVGIIEAMKLMNEIESEYDGQIVKIYVENGQPVQYGERLFAIEAT